MRHFFLMDDTGSVYVYGSRNTNLGFFRHGRPTNDWTPIDVSSSCIMETDIPAWAIDAYVWDIREDASIEVE